MSTTADTQEMSQSTPTPEAKGDGPPAGEAASEKSSALDVPIMRFFETASKVWIPLFACVYGSGYIVVSIYHGSLGITGPGPLKPSIIAAGVLFLAITGLAISTLSFVARDVVRTLSPRVSARGFALIICYGGLQLYMANVLVALTLMFLMHSTGQQRFTTLFVGLIGFGVIETVGARPKTNAEIAKVRNNPVFLLLCGAAVAFLIYAAIPLAGQFGVRQLALYFLVAQVTFFLIGKPLLDPMTRATANWVGIAGVLLLPAVMFGGYVYPHIRPAFGGGAPIIGSITLSDGRSSVQQLVGIEIIDDSSDGIYFRRFENDDIRFIPRTEVVSIEFKRASNTLW